MRVVAVSVSRPQVVNHNGKDIVTGIYKQPVSGPVTVSTTNIEGDEQADLTVHGGVDKAVYAFPVEHYAIYEKEFGQRGFEFGQFGENLTTEGMLESTLRIGDRFQLGEVVFEVSQPRSPCFKFAMKMGSPKAAKFMVKSGLTGYYLRVIETGMTEKGDVSALETQASAQSVAEMHFLMFRDVADLTGLHRALANRALASSWRDTFAERLRKLNVSFS